MLPASSAVAISATHKVERSAVRRQRLGKSPAFMKVLHDAQQHATEGRVFQVSTMDSIESRNGTPAFTEIASCRKNTTNRSIGHGRFSHAHDRAVGDGNRGRRFPIWSALHHLHHNTVVCS